VSTFAEVVRSRAGDERIGLPLGDDRWMWDQIMQESADRASVAGRSADRLRVDSENFAAGPVERIINRWDKVLVSLVYAVPDPRTGDQVMCALQMAGGVEFVPDEFTAFLDAQPDLGTKWRPRFVRLIDRVPTTASNKVAKTSLRREGWVSSDPVFWRSGTETTYRLLDGRQHDALAAEFADHGRTTLLPT